MTIDLEYKKFRKNTERESRQYRGSKLEKVKQFLTKTDEEGREILDKYLNHFEIDLYRAKVRGHVTGLAIKLLAEAKI